MNSTIKMSNFNSQNSNDLNNFKTNENHKNVITNKAANVEKSDNYKDFKNPFDITSEERPDDIRSHMVSLREVEDDGLWHPVCYSDDRFEHDRRGGPKGIERESGSWKLKGCT
eukprot:UN11087